MVGNEQSTIIGNEIDSSPQKISKDDQRNLKNGLPSLVLLEQRVTGGSNVSVGGSETDVGEVKDRNLTAGLGGVSFF